MTTLSRPLPSFLRSLCATVLLGTCSWYAQANTTEVTELLKANEPVQALTLLDQQLAKNPKDPQLRFLQGVAQAMANKNKEAIATFTQLTEEYPNLPEPYNNLAVLYANQNQLDKSREALERAIRTNPSYSTAHENLGDIYAKLAAQAYNNALQLNASHAESVQPKLALIHDLFTTSRTIALAQAAAGKPAGTQIVTALPKTPAPSTTAAAPSAAQPKAQVQPAATPASATPAAPAAAPAAATPPAAAPTVATAPAAASQAGNAPAAAASDSATTTQTAQVDQDVQAAVQAWAKAWAARDMAAYLGAYSPNFHPPGKQSRAAWEKERRSRIVGKKHIDVQLSDLSVNVDEPGRATVRFQQAYKANDFQSNSRKTLVLEQHQGKWLILREAVGG